MVNRGPPYQLQTKSSVPKAAKQCLAANLPCPAGTWLNPNTAPDQAGPICFRCSKGGHLGHDCKQGKPCAAAACLAKDEEGVPEGDHLEEEDQEETTPVIEVEQDNPQLNRDPYLNTLVEDEGTQGHHYQCDDELAELAQPEAPSLKMGAICIFKWKCRGGEGDITCHKNFNPADHARYSHPPAGHAKHASSTGCAMHASPYEPCWLASAKSSGDPPLHDHHVHKHTDTQPTQSCTDSETPLGFWDINGVKVHCLLDSGCEGVMISPAFIHATGIVLIELEKLIGLQLACVGSKSTINYGAESTIMFGTACVEEYLDITNIDYYDVILGTPFLQRLNITLDFTSPSAIPIGTTVVPRNIPPQTSEGVTRVANRRSLSCKPPESCTKSALS